MTMQTEQEYGTPLVWVVTLVAMEVVLGAVCACHSDRLPVSLAQPSAGVLDSVADQLKS